MNAKVAAYAGKLYLYLPPLATGSRNATGQTWTDFARSGQELAGTALGHRAPEP